MSGLIRPLAVLGLSVMTSLGVWQLLANDGVLSTRPLDAVAFDLGSGYDLEHLKLLREVMARVTETYVEPSRIDFERMYVAGVEAVERQVPQAMFHRDEGRMHVHVGDHRTMLAVEEIQSSRELQAQLRIVAGLLKTHLDPEEVGDSTVDFDPYADIEYTMVNGILETLDPHSVLLPPEQSELMDVDNQGEFGGLGITIMDRDGRLTIEYPLRDTPAERAGLQPDDHIVRIDGESTINMSLDDAVKRLRGRPGDPVTIEIMREQFTEPEPFTIVRAKIRLNPVEAQVVEGDFGYIAIKSFHAKVNAELNDKLDWLARETGGMRGLVIDLRGNPGGYLTQAVDVANTFLREGDIVSTVNPHDSKRSVSQAKAAGTEGDYPIAILVNANSASASEIVAGALRNNERAVIIGERTFGKGSVQNLHEVNYESKLKITVAQYLTPGERSIQSVGIPADIELVPSIIEPMSETRDHPLVLLNHRERVRREADLDKHLERESFRSEEGPSYSVRYHAPTRERSRSKELNLAGDYEVQFALDVLKAASSPRRPEMLVSAESVVQRHHARGEQNIVQAFAALGLDWRAGPSVPAPVFDVDLEIPGDGYLVAGQESSVVLRVTNLGEEPLYRVMAITGDSDVLGHREFFFGTLLPGEPREWEHLVHLDHGYPSEFSELDIQFRDGSGEVATEVVSLQTMGNELPRLAWDWKVPSLDEPSSLGSVSIRMRVENVGTGDALGAVTRIKNASGKALDIIKGNLEPGFMVDSLGAPCAPKDEASSEKEVEGCQRILKPGEVWEGDFEVALKGDVLPDGYTLDLSVGDATAYDYATIVRAGFYSHFMQEEHVSFALDGGGSQEQRRPPAIRITRVPEQHLSTGHTTVSGVVQDDTGVANVVIFCGDDKVFFEGSHKRDRVRQVPFTADLELQPGPNTVSVLATDVDGFTYTRSLVLFYEPPGSQAGLHPAGDIERQ